MNRTHVPSAARVITGPRGGGARLSQAFWIQPLHLGIIFLANLELGYLTPPVGLNLFLASYRFDKPVFRVFREALPFLFGLLIVVLLITYVPVLTTWAAGP